ncbi:MAG: chemotaxis protein CheC [Actinobacteria bacterium]|nr:chemotaxis protein CheC [Actinomycetota bacterium]
MGDAKDPGQELSEMQMDALREAGNIGAGNAAIALSQMVEERIGLSMPRASIMPLSKVPDLVGGPEAPVAGIYLRIEGEVSGSIMLLIEEQSARSLADLVLGGEEGEEKRSDDIVIYNSALQEMGSILSGAYLNALGLLTGLLFKPTIPFYANDMAGAIVDCVLVDLGASEDFVIVIGTDFHVSSVKIEGHLILFPDPGTLNIILGKLGVPIE